MSRLAGLSVDVDSVASHLEGYGFERPEDDGKAYRLAVPRLLDVLDALDARCTFFLIVEEASRHPDVLREIVDRGHEVASHSLTHRLPFGGLSTTEMEREVRGSRDRLAAATGAAVEGFRAPSWDLSERLMEAVVDAGYRYDASTYPSFLLPLLRWSVARRSDTGASRTASGLFDGVLGPTYPHVRGSGRGELVEVPICTAPFTRLPFYHTMRFLLPGPVFAALRRLALTRRGTVTYQFHAVDFMGLEEDDLDRRIGRHPGMETPLGEKLALATAAVDELAAERDVVPLQDVVDDLLEEDEVGSAGPPRSAEPAEARTASAPAPGSVTRNTARTR